MFREDLDKYTAARVIDDQLDIVGLQRVLGESKNLVARNSTHANRFLTVNGLTSFTYIYGILYPYAQVCTCTPVLAHSAAEPRE